jgi:hypothetical protein
LARSEIGESTGTTQTVFEHMIELRLFDQPSGIDQRHRRGSVWQVGAGVLIVEDIEHRQAAR